MTHGTTPAEAEQAEATERHASNLELFLDIVFVFAITQIASFISHHPGGSGVAKGVAVTRVLVLCLMPVALLMTIAIPDAFDHDAIWFGSAYLACNLSCSASAARKPYAAPLLVRVTSDTHRSFQSHRFWYSSVPSCTTAGV